MPETVTAQVPMIVPASVAAVQKKRNLVVKKKKRPDPVVFITIVRKDGKTFMEFKVDPRIEQIYKDMQHEIKSSSKWTGLQFYYVPGIVESRRYQSKLNQYNLLDSYGSGLVSQMRFNMSWFRTVGGVGKIEVTEPVTLEDICVMTKSAIRFLKDYFESYFEEFEVTGQVSINNL